MTKRYCCGKRNTTGACYDCPMENRSVFSQNIFGASNTSYIVVPNSNSNFYLVKPANYGVLNPNYAFVKPIYSSSIKPFSYSVVSGSGTNSSVNTSMLGRSSYFSFLSDYKSNSYKSVFVKSLYDK